MGVFHPSDSKYDTGDGGISRGGIGRALSMGNLISSWSWLAMCFREKDWNCYARVKGWNSTTHWETENARLQSPAFIGSAGSMNYKYRLYS